MFILSIAADSLMSSVLGLKDVPNIAILRLLKFL